MSDLTKRQKQILRYIGKFMRKFQRPPSRQDISSEFGFHPNAAQDHLKALERKGAIRIAPGVARGIELTGEEVG